MLLRLYRKFEWVNTSKMIGGPPQWSCQSYDTLQYQNVEGNWIDVPVVEEQKPIRPDQEALVREEIEEIIKRSLEKNAKNSSI